MKYLINIYLFNDFIGKFALVSWSRNFICSIDY